jgi:hypothetical protein
MTATCWCGRPSHNDLLDGCVGDGFLQAMFAPPDFNTMIKTMILMYGDLLAMAADGDEQAAQFIRENPLPKPSVEQDRAMLRLAGMDVTADDVRSMRAHYGGSEVAA